MEVLIIIKLINTFQISMQLEAYKYIKRPIQLKKMRKPHTVLLWILAFFPLSSFDLFLYHLKCAWKMYMHEERRSDKTKWNRCIVLYCGSVMSTSRETNVHVYFIHYRLSIRCTCFHPLYARHFIRKYVISVFIDVRRNKNAAVTCDSYELMTRKSMRGKS